MTARVQIITPQQVEEKKRKEAYHNTLLLLSNSRNILWQTDSELDTFAAELNLPLQKLDAVLCRIDAEIGMENRRLGISLEAQRLRISVSLYRKDSGSVPAHKDRVSSATIIRCYKKCGVARPKG